MDTAVAVRNLVSHLCLSHAAANGIFHHFFMAFGSDSFRESFNNHVAVVIIKIRADTGKCSDAVFMRPSAAAAAITGINAFAAFNQRQNFLAGNHNGIKFYQLGIPC